jgi:hypothetical protein
LYLHGSGYMAGSAFGYRPLAGSLADAAATSVLVPDYRLAPEHPFPAAVEDAMRTYLWMLDTGTAAAQVTVAGDSSGAGLVMSLLLTLKQQGLPCQAPRCCYAHGLTWLWTARTPCRKNSTRSGVRPPVTTSLGTRRTNQWSAR